VIAMQAGYKAGTINVGLNPLYTVPELKQQVNDCGAKVMIVPAMFVEKAQSLQNDPDSPLETVIVINTDDAGESPGGKGIYDFDTLVQQASAEEPDVAIYPDDVAMLQYTGGTTGVSKGCCLTNANILAMCRQHGEWIATACPPDQMRNL